MFCVAAEPKEIPDLCSCGEYMLPLSWMQLFHVYSLILYLHCCRCQEICKDSVILHGVIKDIHVVVLCNEMYVNVLLVALSLCWEQSTTWLDLWQVMTSRFIHSVADAISCFTI